MIVFAWKMWESATNVFLVLTVFFLTLFEIGVESESPYKLLSVCDDWWKRKKYSTFKIAPLLIFDYYPSLADKGHSKIAFNLYFYLVTVTSFPVSVTIFT